MAVVYEIVISQDEKEYSKPIFMPVGNQYIQIKQMTYAQGYSLQYPNRVSGTLVDNARIQQYGSSAGMYIIDVKPGLNEYSFKFNGNSNYKTIRTFSFKVFGIPKVSEVES